MTFLTKPLALLRLEGLATFAVATYLYSVASGDWLQFALLLLVPDVGMLGYLRGPWVGSATYNLFHVEVGPVVLLAVSIATQWPLGLAVALVWLSHIGMDRMLGYGLKHSSAFRDTHLGRIGRGEPLPPAW